jgi:hypothetical protein
LRKDDNKKNHTARRNRRAAFYGDLAVRAAIPVDTSETGADLAPRRKPSAGKRRPGGKPVLV